MSGQPGSRLQLALELVEEAPVPSARRAFRLERIMPTSCSHMGMGGEALAEAFVGSTLAPNSAGRPDDERLQANRHELRDVLHPVLAERLEAECD
jgi:hypothetical protein